MCADFNLCAPQATGLSSSVLIWLSYGSSIPAYHLSVALSLFLMNEADSTKQMDILVLILK